MWFTIFPCARCIIEQARGRQRRHLLRSLHRLGAARAPAAAPGMEDPEPAVGEGVHAAHAVVDAVEEGEEAGDVGDSEMLFAEFNESQGAIAAFRQPDPYNVLDMRIDMFLKNELIPAARELDRFRGAKALK